MCNNSTPVFVKIKTICIFVFPLARVAKLVDALLSEGSAYCWRDSSTLFPRTMKEDEWFSVCPLFVY